MFMAFADPGPAWEYGALMINAGFRELPGEITGGRRKLVCCQLIETQTLDPRRVD